MQAEKLKLIPFPKKITISGKGFSWKHGDRLFMANDSGERDFEALTLLANEIEKNGTSRPSIDKLCLNKKRQRGLEIHYASKSKHGKEGYSLKIDEKGVILEAGTATGVFYGVQTLRQIARSCKGNWPGLKIEDAPALAYRGISISMSQGIMPRPETIAEWIPVFAFFKLNVLQLYMDGCFEFKSHPRIDANIVCCKPEDMLKLEALCARFHIDFQPSFNSFGHTGGHLLTLPEYREMAETKSGVSLCPADPRTYDFLRDIYSDYLPLFQSEYFNVNCDEVLDIGRGRSRKVAKAKGVAALFADHVAKLHEMASKHGKRIQIWSDMVREIPELIDLLPKDIIILNWVYDRVGIPEHPWIFNAVQSFRSKGFEVWGAPGVHNWGSLLARHHTAAQNIKDHVAALIRFGGNGLLNTDWNEKGPPRLPGTGLHGHVLGAAESWTPGILGNKEFDDAFSYLALDDPSGKAMNAIRKIGKYLNNDAPSETTMTYAYLRQPFPSYPRHMISKPSPDYFDQMLSDIEKVRNDFNQIGTSSFREAYSLAGQMAWLGARKARLDACWAGGIGTKMPFKDIRREAVALARDMKDSIKAIRKGWRKLASQDNLDETIGSFRKIMKSLEHPKLGQALENAKQLVNVCVPYINSKGMKKLSGISHLERFSPPPYHHELNVEIGRDAKAFYIRFTGSEPDMSKYKSNIELMNALGLSSYFEVFLAPDSSRPFCYSHLTVSVTGEMLGRVGASFEQTKINSYTKDKNFIVEISIPWKGLEGSPRSGESWRGNFTYSIFKDKEFLTWANLEGGFLNFENFGVLTFS